jgi:hypothetical protein
MAKPVVTAVGRLLKPKGSEPRLFKVIAVKADGSVHTVVNEPINP